MSLAILGLGTAVPATPLPQAQAEAVTLRLAARGDEDHTAAIKALYRQTGIAHRHICIEPAVVRDVVEGSTHTRSVWLPKDEPRDYGPTTADRMEYYAREALPLAERAARRAMDEAAVAGREITHLVTVSCTGFSAPGVDIGLMKRLGLPLTTQRTHVGFMGCHGAMNGLRAARAYAAENPNARILMCAVELCSLHFHYAWDPKRLVANALFADGAAAVVGGWLPAEPTNGRANLWRCRASGSCLFPDSESAMTWDVGNHGFVMSLSSKVPNLIRAHLRPWLEAWLAVHDLTVADIRSWAVHPGGPRILTDVENALDLPSDITAVSRQVLNEFGNMSSPTALFVLDRLRKQSAARPCVAMGFGPGLVVEAALFD